MSKKILLLMTFLIGSVALNAEDAIELGTTNVTSKGFYRSQMKENNGKVVITQEEIQKKIIQVLFLFLKMLQLQLYIIQLLVLL